MRRRLDRVSEVCKTATRGSDDELEGQGRGGRGGESRFIGGCQELASLTTSHPCEERDSDRVEGEVLGWVKRSALDDDCFNCYISSRSDAVHTTSRPPIQACLLSSFSPTSAISSPRESLPATPEIHNNTNNPTRTAIRGPDDAGIPPTWIRSYRRV